METFLFNLNKNQKYKKKNEGKHSIYCRSDRGPWTYGFGFHRKNMKKLFY